MDDFKLVTNWFVRKAIRNQFAINQFLAVFTRTRLNCFYVSCEGGVLGGVLTCMLFSNNNKQEGFVALLLIILTKKLTFKNRENRAISPKTKKTLPVHVTHGICGMLTYDLLRTIYLVKGEKQ